VGVPGFSIGGDRGAGAALAGAAAELQPQPHL